MINIPTERCFLLKKKTKQKIEILSVPLCYYSVSLTEKTADLLKMVSCFQQLKT